MPSPSKIPVFNKVPTQKRAKTNFCSGSNIASSSGSGNKIENSSKKTEKSLNSAKQVKPSGNHNIPTQSAVPGKTSGSRIKPKSVSDRRGISEIKRSEQGLLAQVQELEKEINALKRQMDELERVSSQKDVEYSSLQDTADKFEEKSSLLTKENESLCELVEEMRVNPVNKQRMPATESHESMIKLHRDKSAGEAKELLKNIKSLNLMCGEGRTRLQNFSTIN